MSGGKEASSQQKRRAFSSSDHRRCSQPTSLRAAITRRLSRPTVHDNSPENSKCSELQLADCGRIIDELNGLVATFRDLLIYVGKSHDSPEIRDKMKITRKKCVERCTAAHKVLMPQIRSDVADGIPVDSQHLVNLVCCTQLLLREVHKCMLLVAANPMDMTSYYERRPRSSGVAVLDKLILWRPPLHDYYQEEQISIQRDLDSVANMLMEMQEFMPQETAGKSLEDNFDKWRRRRKGVLFRKCHYWNCFSRSGVC